MTSARRTICPIVWLIVLAEALHHLYKVLPEIAFCAMFKHYGMPLWPSSFCKEAPEGG
jgi:hypothetical protein